MSAFSRIDPSLLSTPSSSMLPPSARLPPSFPNGPSLAAFLPEEEEEEDPIHADNDHGPRPGSHPSTQMGHHSHHHHHNNNNNCSLHMKKSKKSLLPPRSGERSTHSLPIALSGSQGYPPKNPRKPQPQPEEAPLTTLIDVEEPTPEHAAVYAAGETSDDLSFAEDFTSLPSAVVMEASWSDHVHSDVAQDYYRTSLGEYLTAAASLNNSENQHQPTHHASASHPYSHHNNTTHPTGAPGDKTSVPGSSIFRRRNKVSSVDVASVGNASDTMVSVNNCHHMSGRELHETAKVYFNSGDYNKALPLFEAILSAQVRRFSPLHPSVGAAMHNVGVCRQRLAQHALAENLFVEAVQIRERTLGKDHLEVAASLSKLGVSRLALGRMEEAYDNIRQALKIAQTQLGREHKTVAQMLCHLGCFFFEAGELFAAQSTFQDALDIYRTVFPKLGDRDNCMIQITDTLCNIGSIQNRRKRFAGAVESFSEALDLQRGVVGHNDARVIATLDNLGYSYSKVKDYASALSCYRKMLRAQVSQCGTFNDDCLETFRKQILMYQKLKRFAEAVEEIKETLQLERSLLPRDHSILTRTKEMLEDMNKKASRAARESSNGEL